MKKLLIALALILALSLVFVACSDDKNDGVDSDSEIESVVESSENNTTDSGDNDQSDTSDTSEPEDNTPPTNDDGSVNLPKVDF